MSRNLVKVQGEPGLFRDPSSKGIIADDSAYARYKAKKDEKLRELSRDTRINRLEHEVKEIRSCLVEILSILRSNNGDPSS